MNKTRQKIHDIIYEADTPAGKVFDISLIIVIIISVILVALETVGWINQKYYEILKDLSFGLMAFIPFAPITIPMIAKFAKKHNIDLLPEWFKDSLKK